MSVKVIFAESFQRETKRLAKKYASLLDDIEGLVSAVEQNPDLGISLGGNLRKVRLAIKSKGKGKSGGARVITIKYAIGDERQEVKVHFIFIYDKSERESISKEEINVLLSQNAL